MFFGRAPHALQCAGTLQLHVGEWQLLAAALMMGADRTNRHLLVAVEDPLDRPGRS